MAETAKQSGTKSEAVKQADTAGFIGISSKFALLNRLITRDLNNNTNTPTFSRYTKDEISTYLANPYRYEKQLRRAVTYIYGASPHFRRLIQYFVGLSDLSYIVEPYRIDPKKANIKTVNYPTASERLLLYILYRGKCVKRHI